MGSGFISPPIAAARDQIWKVPAAGGKAVPVTRKGGFAALESPDSQWIYYTKSDGASSLWKSAQRWRGGDPGARIGRKHAFAIVREGIYFIPRPDSAGRYSIQFFNFGTKRIRSLSTIEGPTDAYLSVSPDGRWILYSQMDQQGSDLMLVENFR